MPRTFKHWFVYALTDPRNQAVRYVGFTSKTIEQRLGQHLKEAYQYEYRRCRWIRSLLKVGVTPQAVKLEEGVGDGWAEAEIRWIAKFKEAGADLTNHTIGGEGTLGVVRSPEFIEKCRQRMIGDQRYLKATEASRAVTIGVPRSPEVRAKIGAAHKGVKNTIEQRIRQREVKPKKLTDQHIREIRVLRDTVTQKELAARYGVSRSAIGAVHNRIIGEFVE